MNNVLDVVILYLKINRVDKLQPSSFSWYKNQIINITKSTNEQYIRNIFNNLIKLNYIKKIKMNNSILYIFEPYQQINNNVIIIKKNKSFIKINFD
tara:strand:- start:299 stop:586 length:288 start_codon:yes stop_codon:yes gene_type:complete